MFTQRKSDVLITVTGGVCVLAIAVCAGGALAVDARADSVELFAVADAPVSESLPGSNFGTMDQLRVGSSTL